MGKGSNCKNWVWSLCWEGGMNGPAHPGNSWTLLDAAPSVGQLGGQRPGRTALVSGMESHETPTACLPSSSSPFQGRLELFSLRIPSSSLWNAREERGCSRGDGVHVHVCTHVCVCWRAVPPPRPARMVSIVNRPNRKTPPGKAKR